MAKAQEIYRDTVSSLPAPERLRLAALILEDLARQGGTGIAARPPGHEAPPEDIPALARAQAYVQSLVPGDRDLVGELLTERRREARRESAG